MDTNQRDLILALSSNGSPKMVYGRLGAKVPPMQDRPPHPYPHPYPDRFQSSVPSYNAGQPPPASTASRPPPQAPVGPPPIPAFTQPCNHLLSAIHWNPYTQQECRSCKFQWRGPPSSSHPNGNPNSHPMLNAPPYYQSYYPPPAYPHNTSRHQGWDANRGRVPHPNFPPNFVPFGSGPTNPTIQSPAFPRNRFPPQPRPPTEPEYPIRHPPTTPNDNNFAHDTPASSSMGIPNRHRSNSHRAPIETEREAPSARFSEHAAQDHSEEWGRHEPSDSRLQSRPLKSILRKPSTGGPDTTTVTNEADPPPPLTTSSNSKGKSKATSDLRKDTTQTRPTDETPAAQIQASSSRTESISEIQKRTEHTAVTQGSGSQGVIDPVSRPPTPGVILRNPAFDDQFAPKRNRHSDRTSIADRSEPPPGPSKLQKTKSHVKPKLIDLLIHSTPQTYPSIEWDITLSVYRVKKLLSQRHCAPLSKADLRLNAIEPPIKEVFIFTARVGTPLSLVFDQWGPIHVQTKTGATSITIEDILLGIHIYFSKLLTHSEMLELDDSMTARVVDSRNKRWIAAGKTDPDRADVIASTDPLRADELCGYLSYAGLTMDSDFFKSKTLYLMLENPTIRQGQGGILYF